MAVDDSTLLPKVPPPRPAARTSAIDSALRRFDGTEDAPARATPCGRHRAWGGRPQWSLAVSASLVAIIGIPAALIAINDRTPPTPTVQEEGARPRPKVAPRAQFEPPAQEETADTATPPPSTARPLPNRFPVLPDDGARSNDAADVAAPVQAMAPPAPAPPPAAALAEPSQSRAEATDEQSVLVTGSRIAAPESAPNPALRKSVQREYDGPVTAPDWVLADSAYRTFLSGLQAAIRSNDRQAVTRLIAYPLRVNNDGESKLYRDRASVLRDFDRIFTSSVREAVLNQRFEQLFGRDQGVMIGSGAIWFDHVCRGRRCDRDGPVRITAINP